MKVGELKEKLSHYPNDVTVSLVFDDLVEHDTFIEPCLFRESDFQLKYDYRNKHLLILSGAFNEKYLELYEKHFRMKDALKDAKERISILGDIFTKWINEK